MRLIDADKLKENLLGEWYVESNATIFEHVFDLIDNSTTVDLKDIYQEGHYDGHLEGYTKAINEERPQGDLISREALKKKLQEHHDFFVNAWGGFKNLPPNDKARVDEITHCISEVVNAPTVELFCSYLSDREVREPCVEAPCEHERPQGDLISREALLKRVDEERKYLIARGQTGAEHILVHNFRELIDNAPTVEAIPTELHEKILDKAEGELLECQSNLRPQGKWIFKDHNYYDDRSRRLWAKFTCSCCNEQRSFYEIPEMIGKYDTDNFCPNCGADMRGGAK